MPYMQFQKPGHLNGYKSICMFQLKISKPCHADWNTMLPTQQGAFCSSCSKEVVDFTQMSDEEVKNYFLQKHTGSTCGRFRNEQIHRIRISLPDNIFIQKIAGWKKFMAVVLLAFGSMLFGCDVDVSKHTQGIIEVQKLPNTKLLGDTTAVDTTQLPGTVAMPVDAPIVSEKDKRNHDVIPRPLLVPIEIVRMGTVIMVHDSSEVPPEIDTSLYSGISLVSPMQKPIPYTGKSKATNFY